MAEIKGLSYPLRFNALGHLERSSGATKLGENIEHILDTNLGERPMRRDFGILGMQITFKNIDSVTCTLAESVVWEGITKGEERVQLVSVNCAKSKEVYEGSIVTQVNYKVRGTGQFNNFSTEIS
jgi:phage baseplate assembly protein W